MNNKTINFASMDKIFNISDMKDLINHIYKELSLDYNEDSFKDWVLKEATSASEPHSEFTNAFIYIAFKMFEDNNWAGLDIK